MPTPDLAWLAHDVPLWAFLLALLTSPSKWAQRLSDRVDPLLDRVLPGGGGETETAPPDDGYIQAPTDNAPDRGDDTE